MGVSVFRAELTFSSSGSAFPEPHMPHILMEGGDMTPAEYERHLKGKNDFIKGTKKDPSAQKKVRSTSCRASAWAFLGARSCLLCLLASRWPNNCSILLRRGLGVEEEGKILHCF